MYNTFIYTYYIGEYLPNQLIQIIICFYLSFAILYRIYNIHKERSIYHIPICLYIDNIVYNTYDTI